MAKKSPTIKKSESDGHEFPAAIEEFKEFAPSIQVTKEEDVSKDTFSKPNTLPNSTSGPSNALSKEVNPFEKSFDKPFGSVAPTDGLTTPGGTKLPGIAELTSPTGVNGSLTPSFWRGVNANGLRSGPLSPNMLSAPQGDYFGMTPPSYPTPNESGLRSGLSPGGSGSMFPMPEPSPNPIFNEMLGDAVTPGTRSFHETAFRQARRSQQATSHPSIDQTLQQGAHSMPGLSNGLTAMDVKPQVPQYDGQEAHEAVNGLYLLSQSSQAPNHHYSMAPHATIHAHAHPQNMQIDNVPEAHMGHRPHASISTQGDGSPDMGENSDDEPQSKKRKTRATVAKKANTKTTQSNGVQKKASAKGAGKRGKVNNMDSASPEAEPEELDLTKAEYDANGKPCNDEEKRKNFLERNRVAALKCRQRKKQWLQNLQSKVEAYSAENDNLQGQLQQLRDEVVNLKTMLLAHKDCPISHQQGIAGHGMQSILQQGYNPHNPDAQMNPYGMAMGQQVQQQAAMMAAGGPGMQGRRFS